MDERELLTKQVALLVANYREWWGWTQVELAEKSGVHQVMISRLERAETEPTLWTLYRISKAFGLTLSEFFDPKVYRFNGQWIKNETTY